MRKAVIGRVRFVFGIALVAVFGTMVMALPPTSTGFGPNELWAGSYSGDLGTFFADVDGNGKADAIVVNANTVTVRRSTVSASFDPNEDWTHGPYFGTRGTFFADVNGDGRADAIRVNDNTVTVRPARTPCVINVFNCPTVFHFGADEDWTSGPYFGTTLTTFADVDGDGRSDAVVINGGEVTVRRSDGFKFLPNERWATGFAPGNVGTFVFDVTSDKQADLIAVNQTDIQVRRSKNGNFEPQTNWTGGASVPGATSGFLSVSFANFNWFGLSPAMIYVSKSQVRVFPVVNAAGHSRFGGGINHNATPFVKFGSGLSFTANRYSGDLGTFFADVDGDFSADAIVVNFGGVTVRPARPQGVVPVQ